MNYYLKKSLDFFTTLFLITLVTFFTFKLLPGSPALSILGPEAEESQIEFLEHQLNLDRSLPVQYFIWLKNALTGDLGTSYRYQQSVTSLISGSLPATVSLAVMSLIFTILIGGIFGILFSRVSRHRYLKPLFYVNQIWISIPSFCTALILILIFTLKLHLLPSAGYSGFSSLILPSLSIALGTGTILARYIKSSIENELKQDYVRTARSKGLGENTIIFRHILRNSLISSVTVVGLSATQILGGSIIIETVFSLPGIGRLLASSISSRDLPLLQGLIIYLAVITLACNFLIDILYSVIDPRTRTKVKA